MPTMPTAAQLERMRERQNDTMVDTCTIVRTGGRTNDGSGGRTAGTEVTVSSPCRVAPMNQQREQILSMQLRGRSGVTITVPFGTEIAGGPIQEMDKIRLEDGRSVEIIGFSGPHTRETALRIFGGVNQL